MKFPTKNILGLTLVSALALTACADGMSDRSSRAGTSAEIAAAQAGIDRNASRLTGMDATGRPGNVQVRDGLYLGQDGFRTGRGNPLPRRFETEDAISMNTSEELDIREFALRLRNLTGLRVEYRDLAASPRFSVAPSAREGAGTTAPGNGGQSDSTGQAQAAPQGPDNGNTGSDHPGLNPFVVNYTGPLSGLLDYVALQIGADWEYRGGRIKFLGAQTMTYTIWAQPGSTETSSSIGGGDEIFGGATPATTTRRSETNYWESIESGIRAILPDNGATYAINKASGTITVTAYRSIHERVTDFVAKENARLSRQVAVKVDIIAFDAESGSQRAGNLNVALQSAARGIGATISSPLREVDGGLGIGSTVIDADSKFAGSSALVQALSTRGRVSMLDSVSVMAMNNAATPVSIMTEKAYLRGKTVTQTEDGPVEAIDTGVVNNGINMVLTPRILSSGHVNLDYTMNISTLRGIETFQSESVLVQLPEVDARNLMQSVNMESGATMVIAAYENQRNERQMAGPFDPRFWGLGGRDGFSQDTTKILVLMTPVVTERQNAPTVRR